MAVFFTDADTGPQFESDVPRILRERGFDVECHDSHFPERTPDFRWLTRCGAEGWIAITKDQRIRFCWRAKLSIMRGGAKLFVMIGEGRTHEQLAINLARTAHKVVSLAERHQRALIARVYMPSGSGFDEGKAGQVTPWLDYEEWQEMERERDEAKERGETIRDRCI